jgi:acyl carrier protein
MSTTSPQPSPPDQIYLRLKGIAETQLALTPEQMQRISPGLPLVEGFQLDSLAQVTLMAAIEDEFGVVIELEDRQRITTLGDLVTLIEEGTSV